MNSDDAVEYAHALLLRAARGTPFCCTPEQAREWLDGLVEAGEPTVVIEAAMRHLAEAELHAEIP